LIAPNRQRAACWRRAAGAFGISDNDRKYYSLERAREVLGYDPQDNSAEWDGDDHVADRERKTV